MMPCNLCSSLGSDGLRMPFDKDGKFLKGLKQVGKTKNKGACYERIYQCQDCGARWKKSGNLITHEYREIPALEVVRV